MSLLIVSPIRLKSLIRTKAVVIFMVFKYLYETKFGLFFLYLYSEKG